MKVKDLKDISLVTDVLNIYIKDFSKRGYNEINENCTYLAPNGNKCVIAQMLDFRTSYVRDVVVPENEYIQRVIEHENAFKKQFRQFIDVKCWKSDRRGVFLDLVRDVHDDALNSDDLKRRMEELLELDVVESR